MPGFDRDPLSRLPVDLDINEATHAAGTHNGAGVDTRLRTAVVEGQLDISAIAGSGQVDAIRLEAGPTGGGAWTDLALEAFAIDVAGVDPGTPVVFPILVVGKYGVRSVHEHNRHVRGSFDNSVDTVDANFILVRALVHDTRADL